MSAALMDDLIVILMSLSDDHEVAQEIAKSGHHYFLNYRIAIELCLSSEQ